ncbi:EEF1E1 [Lepeophtheirus salmonis]|uniref:EEF1E1 n=1 Tax=Lepeophtheirus salmonis TaxID=72036 RepID=A0A7R8D058_LEPSM|nr:EEF1E1 [Lepeophtheirus salmonis]CAF2981033.1 EEF1E1 [Lepeophtheirus salmonis]
MRWKNCARHNDKSSESQFEDVEYPRRNRLSTCKGKTIIINSKLVWIAPGETWSPIEDKAVYRQWQELESHPHSLEKINNFLCDRTYFAGDHKTQTDELAYDALKSRVGRLSYEDKEKYLNLSRWFAHLQSLSGDGQPLLFSRCKLYV